MRYCSQKVERTRTVKALDRTIKYTCEEKCDRMRSYLLSDQCATHGRPAGRSMSQVFRDDLAFFRTLQRQPVPPIPPRILTRTEQITENTIGTFLPYLNNYLFDCYRAARNKFFIVTQEQSILYSCVVCGIGSSDRSPWSDFLVRGLYDPRILMIIMSLALV